MTDNFAATATATPTTTVFYDGGPWGVAYTDAALAEALAKWKRHTRYGCKQVGQPYSPSMEQWAEANYWQVAQRARPEIR